MLLAWAAQRTRVNSAAQPGVATFLETMRATMPAGVGPDGDRPMHVRCAVLLCCELYRRTALEA